jgi:chitinase
MGGAAGQPSAGTGGSAGNGAAGAAGQSSASGRWLMAYYPGYQRGDLPEADIRFDRLTHLAVGAVLPKNGGELDTQFYLGAETGPAFALALAQRTHQAGKKAILMVGGAGAHEGFVDAASPANRAKLVNNLVQFAKANDFDGLDLDWEPLPASELPAFGELAKALRAAWPEAILTLPITPLNMNFESADPAFGTIAASLDQINVMTYSMAGAYEGWQSWHHTPLRGHTASTPMSVESSVDSFLAAGVLPAKLGIGEGFYGLCYTAPVTAPRQALGGAQAIADDNALSYRTLLSTYLPAATKQWDDIAKAPYLTFGAPTGPQQCTYLSYVDEQAIGEHTAYIKAKGLGGAIVWTIGEGHLASGDDRDPLLGALWNGLK